MVAVLFKEDQKAAERAAEEYLVSVADRLATVGTTAQPLVRLGKPAAGIRAVAEEYGAALTVLATHGRTGVDHLLLGSVAEAVVRHGAPGAARAAVAGQDRVAPTQP